MKPDLPDKPQVCSASGINDDSKRKREIGWHLTKNLCDRKHEKPKN
jgi:hypothetical protein